MKYERKPEYVEAITFEELVEYGKANGANMVNGMPWSFSYKGLTITHENDNCYLISAFMGSRRFERGDMLVTDAHRHTVIVPGDTFASLYQPIEKRFRVDAEP